MESDTAECPPRPPATQPDEGQSAKTMPSPIGRYGLSVPILGATRASYSPICGVTVGPKLDAANPQLAFKANVHERSHHFLSVTRMPLFMRQTAGLAHMVLRAFAKGKSDPSRLPVTDFTVPLPEESPFAEVDAVLAALHQCMKPIQEAFAVYTSTQWFDQYRKMKGLQDLGVDPVKFEYDSVTGTHVPGFTELYLRYREACSQSASLPFWLASYALNGPFPEIGDDDIPGLERLATLTWPERWVFIKKILKCWLRSMQSEWDSPPVRFERAADVARSLPWIAGGLNDREVLALMSRRLPDFIPSLMVSSMVPARAGHPMLGLPNDAVSLWSIRLWEEFAGRARIISSRSGIKIPLPRLLRIQELEKASLNGSISMYLEKLEVPNTYRPRLLRETDFDAQLAMETLGFEFILEQLREGNGLFSIQDILIGPNIHQGHHRAMKNHLALMAGLWESTWFSDEAPPDCRWEIPSCLE